MKFAMITGAGSGLGRAVALALAARGCALALVDIDEAAAAETTRECGHAQVIVQDLTAPGAAEAAVSRSIAVLGGLSIVVNNADYGAGESFLDMREATWDRTLDLNLKAVALICAAAGRHMRDQGAGRIVNVTSPASRMALPNYLA
jgi:NAD(P)-dependent dehydrogenase (short-subunit alcohol dehydrogenase family)